MDGSREAIAICVETMLNGNAVGIVDLCDAAFAVGGDARGIGGVIGEGGKPAVAIELVRDV